MTVYKSKLVVISCCILLGLSSAFASNNASVEFFASNNNKIINMQTAYSRLAGQEQHDLQDVMIDVLQKNHIEQGRFKNILGTYRMSIDQSNTADNTEEFDVSPYQNLSNEKIFFIAKELAVTLKQDSVAVLIPNKSTIGSITVKFTSIKPTINEAVDLLQKELPAIYNDAFSIHLVNTTNSFDTAEVAKIEWLGRKINLNEIKKAFPLEKIDFLYGDVFLVYQSGQIEQL